MNAFGLQHDRDFRFEDEEEKIVFRWEAESRKIFQRRYNWEAEREVTHGTRVFFEPDLGGTRPSRRMSIGVDDRTIRISGTTKRSLPGYKQRPAPPN